MVAIVMGSISDLKVMQGAIDILEEFEIKTHIEILSAHRTPQRMIQFAENAANDGIKTVIAGAGGAAHLPGMIAAVTHLPVIGVPVKSTNSIDGWDSILSILQMPNGVPVATVALNASQNAGILAAQIIATGDDTLSKKLITYKNELKVKVAQMNTELNKSFQK